MKVESLRQTAATSASVLVVISLLGCTPAQQQSFIENGGAQIAGGLVGGVIGNQSDRAVEGAVVGALVAHLVVQQIKASQMQKELAVSRARYAYNDNEKFNRKYSEAKKRDKKVQCIAVKVPKDKSVPESEEGFMLYDPARGKLADSGTVYTSNQRVSDGSVADIGGKRAMIYSGGM